MALPKQKGGSVAGREARVLAFHLWRPWLKSWLRLPKKASLMRSSLPSSQASRCAACHTHPTSLHRMSMLELHFPGTWPDWQFHGYKLPVQRPAAPEAVKVKAGWEILPHFFPWVCWSFFYSPSGPAENLLILSLFVILKLSVTNVAAKNIEKNIV